MAFDCFLQIEGIKGDSTDDTHKQWIEVESFTHEMSQPAGGAPSAQGAHGGGRADHGDFTIVKRQDSASPNLSQYCCDAKHIPNIKIELCRAMGQKTVFMVYQFKDTIVSRIRQFGTSDGADPIPEEEIDFRYGQVTWDYTPTDPTGGGKTGGAVHGGWSVLNNKTV